MNLEVAAVLEDAGRPKVAERLRSCQNRAIPMTCRGCDRPLRVMYACRVRICEHCARVEAARACQKWEVILENMQMLGQFRRGWTWKLVTLTLKHDGDLRDRVRQAHHAFNLLWRRVWEPIAGTGSITALEIAGNDHVHIHALMYVPYIPQPELSRVWEEVSGGSYVVDVRMVHGSLTKALREVLKYISKGISSGDEIATAKAFFALSGTRRVWTKGIFYRVATLLVIVAECPHCHEQDCVSPQFPGTMEHLEAASPIFHYRVLVRFKGGGWFDGVRGSTKEFASHRVV